MIVYIDPSISGVSGDMLLGALLDLGAGEESLHAVGKAVSRETRSRVELNIQDAVKKGMVSKAVAVGAGEEGLPAGRMKEAVSRLGETLELGEDARRFSSETLETLLRAEEAVHGRGEELHLHELGSADTLVDILGVAKLAEELGFFRAKIYSSPVLVGSGSVETAHGVLPVPAPVTAEILKRFRIPFKFSTVEGELATPTGVAILSNLVHSFHPPTHPGRVEKIGKGSGSSDFEAVANVLRIMTLSPGGRGEVVSMVETSVDDVTGEVLGYAVERLYGEGALDVQIIPTVTKKNRPGYLIQVLGEAGSEEALAEVLMEETGTLGVRISPAQMRLTSYREIKKVEVSLPGFKGRARVKVSSFGGTTHVKAEFEDAKRIARKTGLPLREVIKEIEGRGRKLIT
jgi:hypothetical protein